MAESLVETFLGNVGIGTDDPGTYRLKVQGDSNVASLVLTSSLSINGTDNVHPPQGLIALWYDTVASIPPGWVLCDGTNGTPNLTDRFIVGAGSTYAVDATGGSTSTTLTSSNLPIHSHNGSTGNQSSNHYHNVSGVHYHRQRATDDDGQREGNTSQSNNTYAQTGMGLNNATTGISIGDPSANHYHSGSTNYTGSGTALSIFPKYRALAYIMKA